jgi:hypothetical protein
MEFLKLTPATHHRGNQKTEVMSQLELDRAALIFDAKFQEQNIKIYNLFGNNEILASIANNPKVSASQVNQANRDISKNNKCIEKLKKEMGALLKDNE